MIEITQEQKEKIETWASQRDELLLDISKLRTEKERLEKTNRDIASSNTEINNQINKIIGRIEEAKNKENELVTLQSLELSRIKSEKTKIESDVENLNKIIKILSNQKESLEKDISLLTDTFKKIEGRVFDVNKTIEQTAKINSENRHETEELISTLKKTLKELIDVNMKNVFETNVVIEKLPQMLVEIRKQKLMRNKIF